MIKLILVGVLSALSAVVAVNFVNESGQYTLLYSGTNENLVRNMSSSQVHTKEECEYRMYHANKNMAGYGAEARCVKVP